MSDFRQMPLDLPLEVGQNREDLITSPANATAVELFDGWPHWPGKIAILAGPVGSGKSHFARVWSKKSSARIMQMSALKKSELPQLTGKNLVLEDAGPGDVDQSALFHQINQTRTENNFLLVTSRHWPQDWGLDLPDLISRLRAAMLIELQEPDDKLLKQVIHKQFADRQLEIDPGVIDYLVVRMERSLGAASKIVDALDKEALTKRAAITKPMAGKVLKSLDMV